MKKEKEYVYYVPKLNRIHISNIRDLYGLINIDTFSEVYPVVMLGVL